MARPELRAVSDADAAGLISLVGASYAEYPGCVLDLPGVDDDLSAPATTAAVRGGRWWVLEQAGRIAASIGTGGWHADGTVELKRLYVAASHRRRGIARGLVERVEAHAAAIGAQGVELWSDTRFTDAHALYEALGYVRTGEARELHDPSDTTEYRFHKALTSATPRRTVTWHGPHGLDTCHLADLPDGAVLSGQVGDTSYRVEVDASWRPRVAEVTVGPEHRRLTSDGGGRWWRAGARATELDGCTDVDVEVTPATNALPIRRLGLTTQAGVAAPTGITAAWIRVPGPGIEVVHQTYEPLGRGFLRYRAGSFAAELTVDGDGLPIRYGDLWSRP